MMQDQLTQALDNVRRLQDVVLAKQPFYGYSGKARIASGVASIIIGYVLVHKFETDDFISQFIAWGVLLAFALILNYAALAYWFWNDQEVDRELYRLKPALEALAPLAFGAVLTVSLLMRGQYDYLFGVWMGMYGLANIASRHMMPRLMGIVGVYYLLAATICLAAPVGSFSLPLTMGLTFGVGEITAGLLMCQDKYAMKRQIEKEII